MIEALEKECGAGVAEKFEQVLDELDAEATATAADPPAPVSPGSATPQRIRPIHSTISTPRRRGLPAAAPGSR